MNMYSLKYFSLENTFEENKKLYRDLCIQYHPDKPTGNTEVMKAINSEWEEVKKYYDNRKNEYVINLNSSDIFDIENIFTVFFEHDFIKQKENRQKKYVTFKGVKYDIEDEQLFEKIAMRHGGLSLIEFMSSREWQNFINGL